MWKKKETIMATIMEKDVLIEVVAAGIAAISRRTNTVDEFVNNPDCQRLSELRLYLYDTAPEELDYKKILDEVQGLRKSYQ